MAVHRPCSDPRCPDCHRPSPEKLRADIQRLQEKIAERVAKHPEKAATLLKLWLESKPQSGSQDKAKKKSA
jgi:hypothetical protein